MRGIGRIGCFFVGHDVVEGPVEDQGWTTAPPPAIGELYRHDRCDRCGTRLPVWLGFVFASDDSATGVAP